MGNAKENEIELEYVRKIEREILNTRKFLDEHFTQESLKQIYEITCFETVTCDAPFEIENTAWGYGKNIKIKDDDISETLINAINNVYQIAKTKSKHIGIDKFFIVVGNIKLEKKYGDIKQKNGEMKPCFKVKINIPMKLRFIK